MPSSSQRQTLKQETLASLPQRHRTQTSKREQLTSESSWLRRCAQTKCMEFSRHQRREVDIENALIRGRIAIRSPFLQQLVSLNNLTFMDVLHLLTSNYIILDIKYRNFFGYINAMHLLYLRHWFLHLHHVVRVFENRALHLRLASRHAFFASGKSSSEQD